jgi:1,2-diacylglycerol 3-alpha-glucosyltransferase
VVTWRAVARLVAREGLDVVHSHTEFSVGWAAKGAARALGLPLVHTGHTLYEAYRHYLPLGRHLPTAIIARYLRAFLAGYDLLICPSAKARAYYAPLAPDVETVVVGNGVDADRFRPAPPGREARRGARVELGLAPGDRVIVYAGRLGAEKRVLPLLKALAPVLQAGSQYKILFVGDGPGRGALMGAVEAQGLAPQVHFVADVPWGEMHRLYGAADLFATVSLSEVQPMTLIEAAICGLPIVARRDPAYEGLVRDGYNGYLVEADGDLAARVAEILDNEARRRAFGVHARAVAAGFRADEHVARIEALYRRLL